MIAQTADKPTIRIAAISRRWRTRRSYEARMSMRSLSDGDYAGSIAVVVPDGRRGIRTATDPAIAQPNLGDTVRIENVSAVDDDAAVRQTPRDLDRIDQSELIPIRQDHQRIRTFQRSECRCDDLAPEQR